MFTPVESHKRQLNAQHLRARLGQPLTPGQEEEQLHLELDTPPIHHLHQRTCKCIPWQLYMAFMAQGNLTNMQVASARWKQSVSQGLPAVATRIRQYT